MLFHVKHALEMHVTQTAIDPCMAAVLHILCGSCASICVQPMAYFQHWPLMFCDAECVVELLVLMQVPPADNYFAALNSAVFTDGSFVYIPKGVDCPMELSTYFRINAEETGQVHSCATNHIILASMTCRHALMISMCHVIAGVDF